MSTDPTTDPSLIPFDHSEIPDPTGLFHKMKADGKTVDYRVCTLCGITCCRPAELLIHAKRKCHIEALEALKQSRLANQGTVRIL
jgi:hypothetical protein